ncbi:hypothetical protein Zm00014a_010828 [Zea mays]|uniref:Uncharacterized protein n=1 Tax=Zea mays TaxID=4577 RepID=A0A3L6G369_MAIZE|nr:hypothetical protein Zm00014a_010828 [Zea mays]
MVAGKVAVVLLACWTLVLYQPVLGRLPCNNDQKREILRECDPLNSTPDYTPSRHGHGLKERSCQPAIAYGIIVQT